MIRVHEVITFPIEGPDVPVSFWYKTTPFSSLLQKLEQVIPENVW